MPEVYSRPWPPLEQGAPERQPSAAKATIPPVESVDARLVNGIRIILALSALAVTYIAPSAPERLTTLTYSSLIAYCAYSIILYWTGTRSHALPSARINHWADVCFYVYLVALTGGSGSIFFYFFFFPILVASFSEGRREGLLVTAASVALFTLVGMSVAPPAAAHELGRTLIHPVYLLTLGYMIAYWGSYEIMLKRRLTLLKEVNNLWNPRFGVDHAIGINLDRLLDYHGASSCVLALQRPTSPPTFLLYSASPRKPGRLAVPTEIPGNTARQLLRLPESFSAAYQDRAESGWRRGARLIVSDLEGRSRNGALLDICRDIANLLDARTFITVPYSQRDGTIGRIFVTSEGKAFAQSDIEFLSQAAGTISPVVESMHLMDELVSKAAEYERYKISRDIHDTTIQPYIGLKLGLDALYRETGGQGPQARHIGELIEMANMTIRDLRVYAATLRDKASQPGDFLVSAVHKQAERFGRFYGIEVEVKSDVGGQLNNRLAAEAFQIISEGLSNVVRHTAARRAFVQVLCEEENLLLKVGNEAPPGPDGVPDFMPRSIYERAEALGGTTCAERSVDGYTVIHVNIPI